MWPEMKEMDLLAATTLAVLLLAVALMIALIRRMRRARRDRDLARRIHPSGELDGPTRQLHLWHEGVHVNVEVPVGRRLTVAQRLATLKSRADLKISVTLLVLAAALLSALSAAGMYTVTKNFLLAAVAGAAVVAGFVFFLSSRIDRCALRFESQLVDALQLGARSLRAGHPLLGAFQLISEDLEDPLRSIFVRICQQQEMGISLEAALQKACEENHSQDFRLFATSVAIQSRMGGNLADMMDRVAVVIRERIRLNRRVRVITAQTQLSKRILLAIPFVLFLALHLLRPGYMSVFHDTLAGQVALGVAAAGLVVGAWVMNRMVRVEW